MRGGRSVRCGVIITTPLPPDDIPIGEVFTSQGCGTAQACRRSTRPILFFLFLPHFVPLALYNLFTGRYHFDRNTRRHHPRAPETLQSQSPVPWSDSANW